MRDLGELVRSRRRRVHVFHGVPGAETTRGEHERDLLDQLTDGTGAACLRGGPEPPFRVRLVDAIHRTAREGHVPRQEPARRTALQHEHLDPVRAVPSDDRRGGLSQPIIHGGILARDRAD